MATLKQLIRNREVLRKALKDTLDDKQKKEIEKALDRVNSAIEEKQNERSI